MPDIIDINQATASLRETTVQLLSPAGSPINGITLGGGGAALLIAKAGGNLGASAGATLTQTTGGSATDGLYRLRFAAGDVDTAGDLQYELTQSGVIAPCIGYVTVRPSPALDAGTIAAIQSGLATMSGLSALGSLISMIPNDPVLATDTRLDHLDENITSVAAQVWDVVTSSHRTAGTFGELSQVIAGLLQLNSVIDGGAGEPNVILDGNKFMTGARVRAFASPTAQASATPGAADGADGEIFRFTIAATDVLGGFLGNFGLGRTA